MEALVSITQRVSGVKETYQSDFILFMSLAKTSRMGEL